MTAAEQREIEAFKAYLRTGRYDLAAAELGTTYASVQNRLARLRMRYGVRHNTIALVPILSELGYL